MENNPVINRVGGLLETEIAPIIRNSDPWKKYGQGDTYIQRIASLSSKNITFGAYVDSVLVGFLIAQENVILGEYIKIIGVLPEYRSRGIGTLILQSYEKLAFSKVPNIYLCVSSFNSEAIKFYKKSGYKEVGVIEKLIDSSADEILLRKTVGPYEDFFE